MNIKVNRIF